MLPDKSETENDNNLSERVLDKEEKDDKETLEDKARLQSDKLTKASEQDELRNDPPVKGERILDKEEE